MPSLQTVKLIAFLVGAALIALGASIVTHKVDEAKLLKIEAGYKDAQIKAVALAQRVQAAQDKVSLDAAVAEASAQANVVARTNTVTQEVIRYVPIASKCAVSVGFVRVLNAAVLGVSTADVPGPAGKSDDACADADARTLALNIVANYGACNANAEQLGALQGWVRSTIAASKTK